MLNKFASRLVAPVRLPGLRRRPVRVRRPRLEIGWFKRRQRSPRRRLQALIMAAFTITLTGTLAGCGCPDCGDCEDLTCWVKIRAEWDCSNPEAGWYVVPDGLAQCEMPEEVEWHYVDTEGGKVIYEMWVDSGHPCIAAGSLCECVFTNVTMPDPPLDGEAPPEAEYCCPKCKVEVYHYWSCITQSWSQALSGVKQCDSPADYNLHFDEYDALNKTIRFRQWVRSDVACTRVEGVCTCPESIEGFTAPTPYGGNAPPEAATYCCTHCSEAAPVNIASTFDLTWEATAVGVTGNPSIDNWFKGPSTVNGISPGGGPCLWQFLENTLGCGDPSTKLIQIFPGAGPMPGQLLLQVRVEQGANLPPLGYAGVYGPVTVRLTFNLLTDCNGSISDALIPSGPNAGMPGMIFEVLSCTGGNVAYEITGEASVTINNNVGCCV